MSMTDAELAAHLAETAGRILLEVRASGMFSAKALGKAGDQTANQFLCHALREQRPDDGLLSEEEKDNPARLAKSRVWIVDPVDGTREYGEERTDWAVHVGLAIDGVAKVGAVALPALGVVLRSDPPRQRGRRGGRKARRRAGADGFVRREGDGDPARRGGHLSPLGRPI
jgi:3'(2'), 5'-bisphosphate nucleotidase